MDESDLRCEEAYPPDGVRYLRVAERVSVILTPVAMLLVPVVERLVK